MFLNYITKFTQFKIYKINILIKTTGLFQSETLNKKC